VGGGKEKGKIIIVGKHEMCSECETTATKNKNFMFYTSRKYNKETKTCLYLCENHFIDNSTELGRESHPIQSILTGCFKRASNKGFANL
jgi:hypothetical protein